LLEMACECCSDLKALSNSDGHSWSLQATIQGTLLSLFSVPPAFVST
jgi:hypothetical protein